MSEYTKEEGARVESEAVAASLRRAGFAVGAVMMLGGFGAMLAALTLQNGVWAAVGIVEFVSAWWINSFSNAIAHLVRPRF